MDLLIASNSVPLASADTVPTSGTPQWATDGNPATGVPATGWPSYHYNMVMGELYNLVVAAGLAPSGSDKTQVLQAVQALCLASTKAPGTLVQSGQAGNFTVPEGIYRITFMLAAGGGGGGAGGGNTSSAVSAGGGGGGGGWLKAIISVQPGNNVSWVTGAGGAGGINNGSSGGAGGDTILYVSGKEVVRATGGTGGINATEGSVGAGGSGGAATITTATGYCTERGAGGGAGVYAGSSQAWGGIGGPCYGKSAVQVTGTSQVGQAGTTGGGGSGGTGVSGGGAGGAGEVIYEF
ncbi:hypothetical protein GOB93_03350 [Acetobacter musti]|uniref:Glycine-rich domain-containing protein n=1 Tax=Acetobacter musti TaxID=864732 RepID=A0ABX0JMG7_9PROT|nr:hypothetical protein [Acetobacter musti]NHN83676.1 hypothetical protein [Acetobacter musti]